MKIQEIHFNHDPERGGTISLSKGPGIGRDGPRTAITAPEWLDGISQPVAYARGEITGPVTIKVRFSKGPPNERVTIRAVDPFEPQLRPTGPSRTTTVVGGIKPRIVAFDPNGESGLHTFELSGALDRARVGRVNVVWNWQQHVAGERWLDVATTSHLVYVTLHAPGKPWLKATVEALDKPWAEAIDLACQWAADADSIPDSTALIAEAIYSLPHQRYAADSVFVDGAGAPFNLTQYLHDVKLGADFTNECRGITAALVTFANLMGDRLCPLQMWPSLGGKNDTQPIILIGADTAHSTIFTRHETATQQSFAAGVLSPVFDACLKFDGSLTLPLGMPLGHIDPNGLDYRFKLLLTGDFDALQVLPPRGVF